METLHITFKEMFDAGKTGIRHVVIPKIQRAYAQGRTDTRTTRTRNLFIGSIYETVSQGRELTLDFIYGNLADGILTPLDGQQRLTTLYLLHWYAARKKNSGVADSESEFLSRFTYETRYSSRDFCSALVDFNPGWQGRISEEIVDQAWFPLDWRNDATIEAMLVMLDAIDDKFSGIDNLWEALDSVKFYFLPIDKMGLTDDIYIKMNSRGKPLTDFEHFKAEFEKALKAAGDEPLANRVIHKIDKDWTDLLWPYKGDNGIIDDEFLRFFRFVCDIICYQEGKSPRQNDEFALIAEYFTGEKAIANFRKLEAFFDCWDIADAASVFDRFIATDHHEPGKILMRRAYQKYLLQDCLGDYADVLGNRNRKFTLNQIILLYAFTIFRIHEADISPEQFARRLRVIYNLILNSEYEISDSENRTGGNRMPAILRQVDSIVLDGVILESVTVGDDDTPRPNFNVNQLDEERRKLAFTDANPQLAEELFLLEDHPLIRGQIDIVGLDHPERFGRFATLFDCDWDLVDRAMLSVCDYSRRDSYWRIQLGSSRLRDAWLNLFNKSSKSTGYDNVKAALAALLAHDDINDTLLSGIADAYVADCQRENRYPWRYYYIKYPGMRIGRYGKYSQRADTPYQMGALFAPQQESANSYQIFLNEIGTVDRDYYGWRITLDDQGTHIVCDNDAFVLRDKDDNELSRLDIPQNADGIDTTDRIEAYKRVAK